MLDVFEIKDCRYGKVIYESDSSLIYRGIHIPSSKNIIIKTIHTKFPHQKTLKFRQEYEILSALQVDSVIKTYGISQVDDRLVLIMEDFNGVSLRHYLKSNNPSLSKILQWSVEISKSLEEIHKNGIIHKNISPDNILFNPLTNKLKLIDFSIATRFSRQYPTLKPPEQLDGTLAYISPEQTSRMNRNVDYRTDFYSLGAVIYELLCKRPLFLVTDPLVLIHSHITKVPDEPSIIKPSIPEVISRILMKLLEKSAEDRYQSAKGIANDFQHCLEQMTHNKIALFDLAQQDISIRFEIPQKLYGREKEISLLLETYANVEEGQSQITMINGYSGVGKTCLVQELYKPITKSTGRIICGKFNQYQQNTPYSAISLAFTNLMQQLLSEKQIVLDHWIEKIKDAVGENGQVLIDIIPSLELLLGKQPSISEVGPVESQARFMNVFLLFLHVFCKKEHPLVIFIDDLQWVDLASLKVIQAMIEDSKTQYLYFIGAYRSNEVSSNHRLIIKLEELREQSIEIQTIEIDSLKIGSLTQLVVESLHSEENKVKDLVSLIMKKTDGNPFFVNQFLKSLYENSLLNFDHSQMSWEWSIENIKAQNITDNVVELMVLKLGKLPEESRELLSLASCIGDSFDLRTLSLVTGTSVEEAYEKLLPSLREELLLATSDLSFANEETLNSSLLVMRMSFLHDRVQQAAYSLTQGEGKEKLHFKIGRLLLEQFDAEELDLRLFEVIDHLNIGKNWLEESQVDIWKDLNYKAALKAKNATAFSSALTYIRLCMSKIEESLFQSNDALAFDYYYLRAELEYFNANFKEAHTHLDIIKSHSINSVDRGKTAVLLITMYISSGDYADGIKSGREGLKMLGMELPLDNYAEAIETLQNNITSELGSRSIDSLINLPEIVSEEKLMTMEILARLGPNAYIGEQALFPVVIMSSVLYSLRHGNCKASAPGYSMYAILLSGPLSSPLEHFYDEAYAFSMLAYEHAKKHNNPSEYSIACEIHCSHASHWKKHLDESVRFGTEGYQSAVMCGEIMWAGHNLQFKSCALLAMGKPLQTIVPEILEYLDYSVRTKAIFPSLNIVSILLIASNLQGDNRDRNVFSFREISEETFLKDNETYSSTAQYYTYKSFAMYLYGRYEEALEIANIAEPLLIWHMSTIAVADHNFFQSMSLLALHTPEEDSTALFEKVNQNQVTMKIWSEACSENFLHLYLLVNAELARVKQEPKAIITDLYKRAISNAKSFRFLHYEALGNELIGNYLFEYDVDDANRYIKKAYNLYSNWGAKNKLRQMEEIYLELIDRAEDTIQHTSVFSKDSLNINSILKAAQVISSSIDLEQLSVNLGNIIIEVAGAKRGVLLLKKDQEWFIEFDSRVQKKETFESIAFESDVVEELLARNVVAYAMRSTEMVLLPDAQSHDTFSSDVYIRKNNSKSILCFPISHQNEMSAIVYLENDLSVDAFTPIIIQTVETIASQAAICLTNAFLYKDLKLEQVHMQELLKKQYYLSRHDTLTKLPNRLCFDEYLNGLVESEEIFLRHALILVDIDDFKMVNDSLGHTAGDELLVKIAEDLLGYFKEYSFSEKGMVARYSGDEFFMIVRLPESEEFELSPWIEGLCSRLNQKRIIADSSVNATSSMGVTIFPRNSIKPATLLQQADLAMYQSKAKGKGTYSYFSDELSTVLKHRIEIENDLLGISGNFGLKVFYQAKIDIVTNNISSLEALSRWRLASGEFLSPDKFIPYIHDAMDHTFTSAVLDKSCSDLVEFQKIIPTLSISVNFSPILLSEDSYVDKYFEIIDSYNLAHECITFEILEDSAIDSDRVYTNLKRIDEKNFRVSIDDFGTGYSSLSRLSKMMASELKIDKYFLNGIPGDDNAEKLLINIIKLGKLFDLSLVCEGVEALEELEFIKKYGCDYCQGFYFHKPSPANKIYELLKVGIQH